MAARIEDFPKVVQKEPDYKVIGGASPAAQLVCWRMLVKAEAGRPSAAQLLGDRWFYNMGCGGGSEEGARALARQHVRGLMQVRERSSFEKFVARLVATQLDAGQQKRINEAFLAFDADKDGCLSRSELKRGLLMLGSSEKDAEKVVDELDVGKTGRISYTEFLAGVVDLRHKPPKERDKLLWMAWQQFSPNEQGLVKTTAIQNALAARGLAVAELPAEFLRHLRRGPAGEMSFEDFRSLFAVDESYCIMGSFMAGYGVPLRSGEI